MSTLALNLQQALKIENSRVRDAALRTLEELAPAIDDKRLLEEIRLILKEDMRNQKTDAAKESISIMIRLIDSFELAAA